MADIASIARELLLKSGLGLSQMVLSDLPTTITGAAAAERGQIRQMLENLLQVYALDIVESNGALRLQRRGVGSVHTIPHTDLVRNLDGEVSIARTESNALPDRIDVVYRDSDADYQAATQSAQRQVGLASSPATVNTGLVLTAHQARTLAEQLLAAAWAERYRFEFSLPLSFSFLEAGDVVRLILESRSWLIRITSTRYTKGAWEINAISHEADLYNQPGIGAGRVATSSVAIAPITTVYPLNIPVVEQDTHGYSAGITHTGGSWRYATIQARDGGDFETLSVQDTTIITGVASTALPAPVSSVMFDEANTVTVIVNGTLTGAEDTALWSGSNAALLGEEVIQFGRVELLAGHTYRLSHLLRGRRGTEWACGTHSVNDRFTLLEGLAFRTMDAETRGNTLELRAVSNGLKADTQATVSFVPTSVHLKPLSPVHGRATVISGDIHLSWIRRTRFEGGWDNDVDVPLGEPQESYCVEILNGTTVVRTDFVSVPSYTYTTALQTADFGAPVSSVQARVYQLSQAVGKGQFLSIIANSI